MATFEIAGHEIGSGRCFVIAEVGMAHDGSLNLAHAYVEALGATNADAVKFQAHLPLESPPDERWRVQWSIPDQSRKDYWARTAFTAEQWAGLKRHAENVGLVFLCSPFSVEAVDMLGDLEAWKIASGEITNAPLLERVCRTGKPVLISTGMATYQEIEQAHKLLWDNGDPPYAFFQCTTAYPCPPERAGLNVIAYLQRRFGCPVGFSDHSGNPFAGVLARAGGTQLVEAHVVLDRRLPGPDTSSSLTLEDLDRMIEGIRYVERLKAVDKDALAAELQPMRELFYKWEKRA